MAHRRIDTALQTAVDTREVHIGKGILQASGVIFRQAFQPLACFVIADENTFAAAGQVVLDRLKAERVKVGEMIIFPGQPHLSADFQNVLYIEEKLRNTEAIPLAVGSGTINDLTKLASSRCHRAYMVVATAASMDGYTSFGASITHAGFKQTDHCPAPQVVLADLEVLAAAPEEMTASGYADLLGKVTAGADWLVADAMGVESVDQKIWQMVQDPLREWIAEPELLAKGDHQQLAYLFEGLVTVGLAMQAARSSRPASGSEHLFSHLWEMEAVKDQYGNHASHGFKVGIGSIAASALYERLLAKNLDHLDIEGIRGSWPSIEALERILDQVFPNPKMVENAIKESRAKFSLPDDLAEWMELIREQWPSLKVKLEKQLMKAVELRERLQSAGCATKPEEIGLTRQQLKESYFLARSIRRRYTVLDMAAEAGLLTDCVEELFARRGFWHEDSG
jgi:glycerol-1-phosphate dehydrogenase [NAD(P)+]